ncbi:MAG: hypothetical protein ACMXYE_00620 [Candidatus Woesearchaeota archaeon]
MSPQDSPMNQSIPLSKVMDLRSQGTPNNQIIQILQSEGFSSDQIFDAMNQADMRQNIGQGMAEPQVNPQHVENPMQMNPQSMAQPQFPQFDNPHREMIEETSEAIINEKWRDISSSITKIHDWREKMDHRIVQLESKFNTLQENFDKLHQALIGKIGEYDQNILNVGTEIKAMEKVFQKILPTFTDNVNELSRITEQSKNK